MLNVTIVIVGLKLKTMVNDFSHVLCDERSGLCVWLVIQCY